MARYNSLFMARVPVEIAHQNLVEILRSGGFDVIYETHEYIMGREKPGNVPYSKLVTIEASLDTATATSEQVQVKIVAKNEELPLNVDNHCAKLFDAIQTALATDKSWEIAKTSLN